MQCIKTVILKISLKRLVIIKIKDGIVQPLLSNYPRNHQKNNKQQITNRLAPRTLLLFYWKDFFERAVKIGLFFFLLVYWWFGAMPGCAQDTITPGSVRRDHARKSSREANGVLRLNTAGREPGMQPSCVLSLHPTSHLPLSIRIILAGNKFRQE